MVTILCVRTYHQGSAELNGGTVSLEKAKVGVVIMFLLMKRR
jgi:hypothetical protein